jgi:hypothetical protein
MAETLSGQLVARIEWNHQDSNGISTVVDTSRHERSATISNGTGDLQADAIFYKTGTIPGGGGSPVDLDLNALPRTVFGDPAEVAMVEVIGLLVENMEATVNDNAIAVGGATKAFSAPFGDPSDKAIVQAGGAFAWFAPRAGGPAANGSTDILRLNTAGANAAQYKISIMGRKS